MILSDWKDLLNALELMEVPETADVIFDRPSLNRITVYVDGEEYGIYDTTRQTFVD